MKKIRVYKTRIALFVFAGLFIFNLFVFGQSQNAKESLISATGEYIVFAMLLFNFIIFAAGLVWWVFWGRNKEQLKEQAAGWENTAKRIREVNAELEKENTKLSAKNRKLRRMRVQDKKLVYRLVSNTTDGAVNIEELWENEDEDEESE